MTDIEILERANDYVGIHYVNGVEDAYISQCLLEAIKNGIAALRGQEERRWIPVTERLPKFEGTYLVYTERGSVYESHFYPKKVFRDDYVREPQWSQRGKAKVTHWMPLPEPPSCPSSSTPSSGQ